MDAAEGGHPEVIRIRAAELDESAVDGRKMPCSPECLIRRTQQKCEI